ncbi:MAG: LLM class flavin-dependent oxidoreductase [Dehalococcoidia bacterium]
MPDLRFGVTYSERDDFTDLVRYTKKVEELGFDSLWVTENISSDAPALECFIALSFMAANTSRLTIGTSVLLLPLRNPVLVAQTVNSLDILSGGRLVLGVGVGDVNSEHEAYGGVISERGSRCDESLELMKRLWTESPVTFHGRHYTLNDYVLLPRPVQKPHPPIWVGGHAESVLRRAGQWADGYIPVGMSPERCVGLFEKVESYARSYGRSPSSIARTFHGYLCLSDSREESARITSRVLTKRYGPTEVSADIPALFGTPEECRKTLREYIEIGVTHFVFNMTCQPEEAISQAEVVAKEVLPQLS